LLIQRKALTMPLTIACTVFGFFFAKSSPDSGRRDV
jgi:hypothetical protein